MLRYVTVATAATAEIVIEKSKFIADIRPAKTKAEADVFFEEIRLLHRAATHHVPAFLVGEKMELQWASDDGEPQGTSGAPMLRLLSSEGITNVAVIVTRYFGGIKLGTGGLVRAYTAAAKAALEAAGRAEVHTGVSFRYEMDYSVFEKLKGWALRSDYALRDVEYGEKIRLTISAEKEAEQQILSHLAGFGRNAVLLLSKEDGDMIR